jgi:hypothetical protein
MTIINHSIIGGGFSSLIKLQVSPKAKVFCSNENKIIKSLKFYEKLNIGGNSNIWGGYINYNIYKLFTKNKKFKNFIQKQKIYKLRKLFLDHKFSNTYYISNFFDNHVLRIKAKHFNNSLITKKINKISQKNNIIILHSKNKKILTKKLSLCIGNLSLIRLLYKSKLIKSDDKISFIDGNVSYGVNSFLNLKKNYYIPMSFLEILEKLFRNKKKKYDQKINKTIFVQKFSKKFKKYFYTVNEILNYQHNFSRYFVSHHLVNLCINNIPINIFIKKHSKNITIYNSGAIQKYLAGPISQSLIFNAVTR